MHETKQTGGYRGVEAVSVQPPDVTLRRGRPVLVDLFCGAGGAGMGYYQAGFDVIGVDIDPQPDYPFRFIQADAIAFLDRMLAGGTWDWVGPGVVAAYHGSPPCQGYSSLSALHPEVDYPKLVGDVRARFRALGRPYVIENVIGSPMTNALLLCGSMFGMRIRRHRLFDTSDLIYAPSPCQHHLQPDILGVYGNSDGAHEPGFKHEGHKRGPRQATTTEAREVMEMPWVTKRRGLTEAIPPRFTRHIGEQLLSVVEVAA